MNPPTSICNSGYLLSGQAPQCPSLSVDDIPLWTQVAGSGYVVYTKTRCSLPRGHQGQHQDVDGRVWND